MYQMDETDYEILEILKGDGRCSYSDIAEQVHLSRVAVRERINNMKEGGVIRGFTVVIDAKAYQSWPVYSWILKWNPARWIPWPIKWLHRKK